MISKTIDKYNIYSNKDISAILDSISDKRRIMVYDFTKLKLLLGK